MRTSPSCFIVCPLVLTKPCFPIVRWRFGWNWCWWGPDEIVEVSGKLLFNIKMVDFTNVWCEYVLGVWSGDSLVPFHFLLVHITDLAYKWPTLNVQITIIFSWVKHTNSKMKLHAQRQCIGYTCQSPLQIPQVYTDRTFSIFVPLRHIRLKT
jgi:hypothetical protein